MALIEQADVWLFQLLNLHLVHPAADDLMVFLTRLASRNSCPTMPFQLVWV